MRHLKTFESYESHGDDAREEMIGKLCNCGWERHELEEMSSEELSSMCRMEEESPSEVSEKKWIQDAIKRPGSLRRKLHKGKGEKISSSEIEDELASLRKKDKDPEKAGVQLGSRDRKKYQQLNLAKTLRKFK